MLTTTATRPSAPAGTRLRSMDLVRVSWPARLAARLVILALAAAPVVLWFVPWQQNVTASGRVIAFDPTQRQQEVEAPVDGRVLRWHVKEGQRVRGPVYSADGRLVRPGDPLVSIQDPDPDLPARLGQQRRAVLERQRAARERVASFEQQIDSLKRSREQALSAGASRLDMARQRLAAARESVRVAALQRELASTNFRMESQLVEDGLTSKLNFLTARQRRDQTVADEKRAVAARAAAEREVEALQADVEKVRNDAEAGISSATASRQSAEAELASATRDLAEVDTRIARQANQEVTAPCDGVVYRVIANAPGGALVKSGERLLVLTPDIKDDDDRIVELFVEGNDAPQMTELLRRRLAQGGDADLRVRLQFEGWPAIRAIGWPTLAWGTFGGKIVSVDPHDDGKGRFRVLVRQDPGEGEWPDGFSLRQGGRVQGWVLLDRVSLGYELWRRFNGFPPVVVDKARDDEPKKKPEKVKVPK